MISDPVSDVPQDVDRTLRRISRRFPEDFARAFLPPDTPVTSATWLDTQTTSARQRRLDRVLEVIAGDERRVEHTEWQMRWTPDVPHRMHEYHNLMAGSLDEPAAKAPSARVRVPDATPQGDAEDTADNGAEIAVGVHPVPIRSTVVLLTGREKPWPAEGSYRTSPASAPFSGVTFSIDAVYQRTVADLAARGNPFWLIFAPLAVDADKEAMERVVALLRERTSREVREELAVGLVVMADVDRRRRGLRSVIVPLLKEEKVMESWLYKQGEEKGEKRGEKRGAEKTLVRSLHSVFVRCVGRSPTADEEKSLARRARDVSVEQVFGMVDMPGEAFLAWLAAG